MGAGYSGFVNSDSSTSLTTPPTCKIDQSGPYQANGAYTTSCSGAVDSNYTYTYVPGTLTVSQAPLTLGVTGSESYGSPGSASFELDGYASGFVNSEGAGVLNGSPSCATSANPTATNRGIGT